MTDHDRNADPSAPPTSGPAPGTGRPPSGIFRPEPAPYQQINGDQRSAWRSTGQRRIGFGVLWLVAGVLITVITMAHAAHGGVYVVAFGPTIYGLYQLIAGARLYAKGTR